MKILWKKKHMNNYSNTQKIVADFSNFFENCANLVANKQKKYRKAGIGVMRKKQGAFFGILLIISLILSICDKSFQYELSLLQNLYVIPSPTSRVFVQGNNFGSVSFSIFIFLLICLFLI